MVSIQPIQLWRYLGLKRNKIPKGISRLFYLSWEDALWDLLLKKNVPKGSYILVPEFYCGDVENNIRTHGYNIARYPVARDMTTGKKDFIDAIRKCNPSVVVIFHAFGISNRLLDKTLINKYINPEVILIEDSVHRIVNPDEIKILKENHFIVDSLRKVVPMQGANVYGRKEDLNFKEPAVTQSLAYSLAVHSMWLQMVICWNLGFYKQAENLMVRGYDLIGDSQLPSKGFFLFKQINKFVRHDKIEATKERQIKIYEKYIKTEVAYRKTDRKKMRGYPLVLEHKYATRVLESLRKHGLAVRFELDDGVWSKKQKIVSLPVGLHTADTQIMRIAGLVKKSIASEVAV